jgi:hypothetical protein
MTLTAWMKWHRWAGAAVALFVALVCATGIVLNHSAALGLVDRYVASGWLLEIYGVAPPGKIDAFLADGHWASRVGERIYFDAIDLGEPDGALVGMVRSGDLFVIALTGRLVLISGDGRLVESLREEEGTPAGMRRIGITVDGRVIVDAAGRLHCPDLSSLKWEAVPPIESQWSEPSAPPPELAARLNDAYRARALSLERILLDVHSGRIVQRAGVWVMDAVALVLISLVLSGLWIWYRK